MKVRARTAGGCGRSFIEGQEHLPEPLVIAGQPAHPE
jgi:hypothetical protein